VAAVSPMLRLTHGVAILADTMNLDMAAGRLIILAVLLVALSALLLSAAGIYALMSITITRRRREIGIRSALGGQPRRLLASILSRATGQIAIGIVIGVGLSGLTDRAMDGWMMHGQGTYLLPGVAALMTAVGLVAAIGPARRALRIQPTEALKAE
ncbi:MAG TPA: FtsX-like permease family protein, partial [Gemmatimonadaceae bacterium]|nr:FtsX-like permease family protein [Gemmatimonadaceae bacterium]